MRRVLVCAGLCAGLLWFAGADSVLAQAKKKGETAKESAKAAADESVEKPKGRLPSGYGKLELSDVQRDKILTLRAKYEEQIDKLEAELAALKSKRDAETEALLTADQRKKLAEDKPASKKTDAKKAAEPEEEEKPKSTKKKAA